MTFGITEYKSSTYYFTSIVIEKNQAGELPETFEKRDTFNILYADNFDPNTRDYIVHVQDVDQVELPNLLMELSRMYFENLGMTKESKTTAVIETKQVQFEVYQCESCQTIYDYRFGDITQDIKPGVHFEDLPDTYACSLCEGPVSAYRKVTVTEEIQA